MLLQSHQVLKIADRPIELLMPKGRISLMVLNSLTKGNKMTESKKGRGGRKGRSGPPGNGNARTHGVSSMRSAIRTIRRLGNRGLDGLDGRSRIAKFLRETVASFIEDLGGEENVTTAQRALVDQVAVSMLIMMSVNVWILDLERETLLDKSGTGLLPVVRTPRGQWPI